MAETTGRLLRLLSLLQARPAWPGHELAQRLEVTETRIADQHQPSLCATANTLRNGSTVPNRCSG